MIKESHEIQNMKTRFTGANETVQLSKIARLAARPKHLASGKKWSKL
jgi:hypothetical protein